MAADKEFATLCFQFGVELDDITSEKQMEQVARAVEVTSMDNIASHEIIFKIDIPANRYDLLCVEGIAFLDFDRVIIMAQVLRAPSKFSLVWLLILTTKLLFRMKKT